MSHFLHVVGARPNFMKAAPLLRALAARSERQTLVHSGQHYDQNMSGVFFEQLGIREPDINLQIGGGTHAQQTAAIMVALEPVLQREKPDAVIVYGDVNSTLAAALVCSKLGIRLIHVEAGLRSFDRAMPEEINRLITDTLADILFTPSIDANDNLRREGIDESKVHLVGNIMIDTLVRMLPDADARFLQLANDLGLERFGLVTLHRPSNVDDAATLSGILAALSEISHHLPLIFPVHPRTRQRIEESGIPTGMLRLVDPLPYVECLALQQHAAVAITDSGGIQEESTYLGVPCLTLRSNTERPITVTSGTNVLIGSDLNLLIAEARRVLSGEHKTGSIPALWDGHTAERIADVLVGRPAFAFVGRA